MSAPDNPQAAATPTQRLFFALWPDDPVRVALAALMREQLQRNGRAVPVANLHITLAFLGSQSADQRDCAETAAAEVAAPGFELAIDRLGYWARPRIFWAGASAPPPALTALVTQLNQALTGCGYQPETRPFQAHITLARKALRAPTQIGIEAIAWAVRDFCLVESVTARTGSEYRVLARWPLLT